MARRHESLIPVSHDHHDALLLAWRLRTGDLSKREPELRASHVSAFFEYRLINHFKVEEELLFPEFREVLGLEGSLIEVLLGDHQELRAQAAAIKAGANDQVDSFCVLLERHIRTEERQLFVLAQNRMKPARMAELGRQIKLSLDDVRNATKGAKCQGHSGSHAPQSIHSSGFMKSCLGNIRLSSP